MAIAKYNGKYYLYDCNYGVYEGNPLAGDTLKDVMNVAIGRYPDAKIIIGCEVQ